MEAITTAKTNPTENGFNAETIIRQLGGQRFITMTGAHTFTYSRAGRYLTFKLPANLVGPGRFFKITFNDNDLYTLEFSKFRKLSVTVIETADGIYSDQLQSVFSRMTRLATHL